MRSVEMFFCDAVTTDDGFPTIHSICDVLGAPTLPVAHRMVVYVQLALEADEEGQGFHTRLDLLDGAGRNLLATLREGDSTAPARMHPQMRPIWGLKHTLDDLTFPETGEYLFRLTINDQVVAERTFTVVVA